MHCPCCGHPLSVRAEYLGRRVTCRFCRSSFVVQGDVTDAPATGDLPVVPSGEFPEVTIESVRPCGLGVPGYEPLGLIRNGAMGQVHKARQKSVDRVVAVKVLQHGLSGHAEYVVRFRREATFAARLAHTNIPHLIDAGEVDGCPYLVMEYVEGETALDLLNANGVFPEAAAVEVALGVAEALDHVHGRGLIHRDVKPANLILTTDGDVKLIDFGLARLTSDEDWAAAEAGNAIGTPEYISPEQTRGQSDLDARTDLYSLGATLYHLVTGRPPYSGTSQDILRQHADPRARPAPPSQSNPSLGAGFVTVIDKLMANTREDRYRHADELIGDLHRVRRGE